MTEVKHCIIVPVYNKPVLTNKCLASLVKTTKPNRDLIVVVDDASNESTQVVIRKYLGHPQVKVFRNNKNQGKPKSINAIMKKYSKSDYFTVIDNDVELKTLDWVSILLKAHKDWDNNTILGGYTYMDGYKRKYKGQTYLDPWPFWNLAGCFFSITKNIFNTLGYFFDKSYRSEDSDYCRRAYLAGFHWFYIPEIKANITGYKNLSETNRLTKLDLRERKIRRTWTDQVMRTHKVFYRPNKFIKQTEKS
ncbi:MAG: glycosyltransferase [Patescibacteria group bacterium]